MRAFSIPARTMNKINLESPTRRDSLLSELLFDLENSRKSTGGLFDSYILRDRSSLAAACANKESWCASGFSAELHFRIRCSTMTKTMENKKRELLFHVVVAKPSIDFSPE